MNFISCEQGFLSFWAVKMFAVSIVFLTYFLGLSELSTVELSPFPKDSKDLFLAYSSGLCELLLLMGIGAGNGNGKLWINFISFSVSLCNFPIFTWSSGTSSTTSTFSWLANFENVLFPKLDFYVGILSEPILICYG